MKRYLIFGAIGPFFGGLLLLFATTVASGYWTETSPSEVGKFFVTFVKTLQYSYLFGIVPALMIGAIDDILYHVPRIRPGLRICIMGVIGFTVSELMYGSRGPDSGLVQFLLYGLVGCGPATLSSWLANKYADEHAPPVHST
jgi:multisubunit Na+/H+ antiporter MnhB subunit